MAKEAWFERIANGKDGSEKIYLGGWHLFDCCVNRRLRGAESLDYEEEQAHSL